jgi:tetratricopeptide (TPR) repeat protein
LNAGYWGGFPYGESITSKINSLEKTLETDPSDYKVLMDLGRNYMQIFMDDNLLRRYLGTRMFTEAMVVDSEGRILTPRFEYFWKALKNFGKVLEGSPGNDKKALVWWNLGLIYSFVANWKSISFYKIPQGMISVLPLDNILNWQDHAFACAERATEIAPNEPIYWSNLGGLYHRSRELERSLECLKKAAELVGKRPKDQTSALVWHNLGVAYLELGNESQAKESIKKAYILGGQINPENAKDWYELGLKVAQTDKGVSEILFLIAIDVNPKYSPALNELANIYRKRGDLEKSLEYVENAIEDPDLNRDTKVIFLINLGNAAFENANLSKAIKSLEAAKKLNSEVFRANYGFYVLGQCYFGNNEVEKAIKCLEESQKFKPSEAVQQLLNLAYPVRGKKDPGIKLVKIPPTKRTKPETPDHPSEISSPNLEFLIKEDRIEILMQKGNTFFHAKQISEAIACLRRVETLDYPKFRSIGGLTQLGICYTINNGTKDAIKYLAKAINYDSNDREARLCLSQVYIVAGKRDEALKWIESAKSIERSINWELLSGLPWENKFRAIEFDWAENYPKAAVYYEKSIEIEPKDSISLNRLAWCYYLLKKYEEAIKFANDSVKIDATYKEAWNTLACAYYGLEQYQKSWESFEKMRKIDSTYKGTQEIYEKVQKTLGIQDSEHEATPEDE